MDDRALTDDLKSLARDLGFAEVGVCAATLAPQMAEFDEWLARGYAGQMRYLPQRRKAYEHPRDVLDGVTRLVMLAMPYRSKPPAAAAAGQGRVACYAQGTADYHDVIHRRLAALAEFLKRERPEARVRGVVDTAPLFERQFARLAGLGWQGKNTLLLNQRLGSWFFLAALLTDATLVCDEPFTPDHCGTCRACLDACPTQAFPQPYVLDARRCISYLTIEHRGPVADETLRKRMAPWVFGCDVCQEVCPWNRKAAAGNEPQFEPLADRNPLDLLELLTLTGKQFRERFRKTPLWRSRREGMLRNAAYVLGGARFRESADRERAIKTLSAAIPGLPPAARDAAAWAIERL